MTIGDMPQETAASRHLGQVFAEMGHVLAPEDLIHMMLGVMRDVATLHERGEVADLALTTIIEQADGRLALLRPKGKAPTRNLVAIERVQPKVSSALKLVGEYRITTDDGAGTKVENLSAAGGDDEVISTPVYLPDLRCWEIELGHHDPLSDIFVIGMILASLACGFDPANPAHIARFADNRANLFAIAPYLHPVIATIILEATMLNRHERATDLGELAKRLETYRDQPVALDVERILAGMSGGANRRSAVLGHLRDRLFDLSRRNKLIHFRPTQSSVNLTEASIPIVMRIESIRADDLCTWKGRFAESVLSGKNVALNQWLRFEDQPHLPSSLDRLMAETRRDRAEYGFSHLRLVVAFFHWHNLKEAPGERITSPLLWLPVEVSKAKGVRDQYVVKCADTVAQVNPALRHMLRQLYAMDLPEEIDLAKVRLEDVHADLMRQIHQSEPGVRLELQQRPQIQLIHRKAVQRVNQFNRRRQQGREKVSTKTDFSYARDDYRPLGLALFEKFVRPSPLPQRIAAGGSLRPRADHAVAQTEALSYAKAGHDGHKFAWEFDLTQVTLANLNYKKMSLVRDYTQLIDEPEVMPGFDQVFSIEPRKFMQEAAPALPVVQQWNVVSADATQDAAVALARTGRSFIIQGPPGTGKSQTITNLIADYVANGKRVLFVCEKRAALDVVFHRLGQAGLAGLACMIHDSQEDKKAFIANLKEHYESWGKSGDQLEALRQTRDRIAGALDQHLGTIAAYDAAVGGEGAHNLRRLIARAAQLPPVPQAIGPQQRERLPDVAAWDEHRGCGVRVFRALADVAGAGSLAQHPFALINAATLLGERPYAQLSDMIEAAEELLDRLDTDAGEEAARSLNDALACAILAERLVETGLHHSLDLLDGQSAASARLQQELAQIERLEQRLRTAIAEASHWHDPLDPADTLAAADLAQAKEGSFLRFLSGAWRRLHATVRARYDFSAHAVTPRVAAVLELLLAQHRAVEELAAAQTALSERSQTSDLAAFLALRTELLDASHLLPAQRKLIEQARLNEAALPAESRQAAPLRQLCVVLVAALDGMEGRSVDEIGETLRDLREALDDLPDMLPMLRELHQTRPEVSWALRHLPLPISAIEAVVIDEAIARVERARPDIRKFDIERLISTTRRASAARDQLRGHNANVIKAARHRLFLDHVRLSEQSVTQLDTAARALKKTYATGRRELEHEFGKSMRHRSIRDLASGDTGAVINDLKPIWLMSPLSVSDTLPLRSDLFDVVIFDEASQIPTEEAVPALSRAAQVIVVGDEMQLPPTSFFSSALDEEDMQVYAEEDGEQIAIMLDADSLLNQAARNLPATLLAWHYRSRSEALISFSNAAFYAGQLVTIPDRSLHRGHHARPPAFSTDEGAGEDGVRHLLSMPITTHRIADGLYEQRCNRPEARYIAAMVRQMLLAHGDDGHSLGIVAFSEAQQSAMEDALEELAAEDTDFATALEREYLREDDGQFNGLFVKNLENVQGDERDIIIMSVCYAPGRDGRMAMNFGPINQRGGEKRLNVIFSRARRHMAIVSTIAPEAITNTHNDGARALRSFLAFAEAQSGGAVEQAETVLATLNPDAARTFGVAPPVDPVRDAIADALRGRGHDVHIHVGGASFRCDLAIVADDGASYALGIMLDRDDPGLRSVEERFVFRPQILRAFGWRVIDVPVAAWHRGADAIVERIERELTRCSWDQADDDPMADVNVPEVAVALQHEELTANVETGAMPMTELRFAQGTSNKFWRIGVQGCDVIVEYGRVGTNGQRVVKTFPDTDRAAREATKLTLEKTRKGYLEL